MLARLVFDILLLFAIYVIPPYFSMAIGIVALFYFGNYYELIFYGLILDILYGLPMGTTGLPLRYTITSVILCLVIQYTKRHLKFYE